MNLDRYAYFTANYQDYVFYSEGPKGKIKKVIRFTKVQEIPAIYNLAFGDEDPETGSISDMVTTDNNDRDIVLATVANSIIDFSDHFGNHYIYAEGSTLARTRLYQMGILRLWDDIRIDFDIYGLIDGVPSEFKKNVNYDAFLVKRK